MPLWIRLDVNHVDHPKILALSDGAYRWFIAGLCYAKRYQTDGWLPAAFTAGTPRRAWSELVDGRLWVPIDGGHVIHDFLDWQDSRAEVEEQRKRRSEAGRAAANARWHKPSEPHA